jgi:sarcosine oxidase delta subunit
MPETPLANLKCPHCNSDLPDVEFRIFGDGKIWLIGCPHCLKVIGGNFELNIPEKKP